MVFVLVRALAVPPIPAIISPPIVVTVHAFVSPFIVLLSPASLAPPIPLIVILVGIDPSMMSREGVASVHAFLTVVVNAGTILSVTTSGYGQTSGREQDSKVTGLHFFRPPLLDRSGFQGRPLTYKGYSSDKSTRRLDDRITPAYSLPNIVSLIGTNYNAPGSSWCSRIAR